MEYNFSKAFGKTFNVENFTQYIKFIHAYNDAKAKTGSTNETEIIENMKDYKNNPDAAKRFLKAIKSQFGHVPSKEDENEFMQSYYKYMHDTYNVQKQRVDNAKKHYEEEKTFQGPNGVKYSSKELAEAGEKARKKARGSKWARFALIALGAVAGSYLIPLLLTTVFTGVAAVSTISAISMIGSVAGLIGGGLLGARIYNAGGRRERLKANDQLSKFWAEMKDAVNQEQAQLESEETKLKELERDFGLSPDEFTGFMDSQEFHNVYDEYSTAPLESASEDVIDPKDAEESLVDEAGAEQNGDTNTGNSNVTENSDNSEQEQNIYDDTNAGTEESADEVADTNAGTGESADEVVDTNAGTGESADEVTDTNAGTEESADGVVDTNAGTEESADEVVDTNAGTGEPADEVTDTNAGTEDSADGAGAEQNGDTNTGNSEETENSDNSGQEPAEDKSGAGGQQEGADHIDADELKTKKKKMISALKGSFTKSIDVCSAVGRYMLVDLREGALAKIGRAETLDEVAEIAAQTKEKMDTIKNDYKKYVTNKSSNNVTRKNLIYLEELPEDKKGAHANDTQLPDDFISTTDGKTLFATLATTYIRQNEELIKKYTKAKNAELKPAQRRANAQDLYNKASEIAKSGQDFAEIDKIAMDFQAELASSIQELSVGSISIKRQEGEDKRELYTAPEMAEPKTFEIADGQASDEDTIVIKPSKNGNYQEEIVEGASTFELEEQSGDKKTGVERISREALDALNLGQVDRDTSGSVDCILNASKKVSKEQARIQAEKIKKVLGTDESENEGSM